jgi:predicted glycoside hydrolase/deacetylase ChbG (UPF0249 family)
MLPALSRESTTRSEGTTRTGALIFNADDWGQDRQTTDRTLECIQAGTASSVSAMVFMEDSERAAAIAGYNGIDAGLHLNFTTVFSSPTCPAPLMEHQCELGRHLSRYRLSQLVFNPSLDRSFEYVVSAQIDEFCRLYGIPPRRLDGHHHMHLCANVILGRLLPAGSVIRRNYTFRRGEKSWPNRLYRHLVDCALTRRHRITDFFFSLMPLQPERIQRIASLAHQYVVEVETHPVNSDEYQLLAGGEIQRWIGSVPIAPRFAF